MSPSQHKDTHTNNWNLEIHLKLEETTVLDVSKHENENTSFGASDQKMQVLNWNYITAQIG